MSSLEFTVIGCPKPQQRPRIASRGKFSKMYSPSSEWKQQVIVASSKLAEQGNYYDQAINVCIYYYFDRPKAHYGTGKNSDNIKSSALEHHIKKPDLDNLNKAVLDAMTDAKLLKDDSIITHINAIKKYNNDKLTPQRATIVITEV